MRRSSCEVRQKQKKQRWCPGHVFCVLSFNLVGFKAALAIAETETPKQFPLDKGPEVLPQDCRGLPYGVELTVSSLWRAWVAPTSHDGKKECRVVWASAADLAGEHSQAVEALLEYYDFVLTDSFHFVPFAGRDGRVVFHEKIDEFVTPPDLDAVVAAKQHMVSVLLPARSSEAWKDPDVINIQRQAEEEMPEHTFTDDGSLGTFVKAFLPYRFVIIVDPQTDTLSEAFIRSMQFSAVPVFNGFVNLGAMFPRGILPFNKTHFDLVQLRTRLPDVNYDMGWLWNYHRMLQDSLAYRFAQHSSTRLASTACTLCRLQLPAELPLRTAAHASTLGSRSTPRANSFPGKAPALAFVAVYSAKANFAKRAAVRATWGRVFQDIYSIRVRFFLGALAVEATAVDEEARREAEEHGDLIVLDVPEGYKMNSKKGLLFLQWCAKHMNAEFLLKVDDDVYLRPAPVLAILHTRAPAGFLWGYMDYMSPVPDDTLSPFFNDKATYPFDVFPPYPRGLVRAMSMDVVRRLAVLADSQKLNKIFGDDPSLGVHLKLALMDDEDAMPSLTFDDRESYRAFAMEPSCSLKLWSHVTHRSWVVHHVTAEQVMCMWEADLHTYYEVGLNGKVRLSINAEIAALAAARVSVSKPGEAPAVAPLPDVCHCLVDGPLAEALAKRIDKVNASETYRLWGEPDIDDD